MKTKRGAKSIKRLLAIQLVVNLMISIVLFLFYDLKEGYSALLGGFIALIPSFLFAKILFRYQGALASRKIVKSFYVGEALKLCLTIILFALVFSFINVAPLALFSTYILVLMSYWFLPLMH